MAEHGARFVCLHGAAKGVIAATHVQGWDDGPAVSDGYAAAREAIDRRLVQLVDELAGRR